MSYFSHAILSLDGGGIRGIIPCTFLMEIEKRAGRPIAELFDLIAGTSTGGMLASGLATPGPDGKPLKTAAELLEVYMGPKGAKIFHKTQPSVFHMVKQLWTAQFPATNIEPVLEEEFGDVKLSEALTNLLITSYCTESKAPFYFRSSQAKMYDEEDFLLREIARSTSAAPTYFPPTRVRYGGQSRGRKIEALSLIDGGVFANNPSVLAFTEAQKLYKHTEAYRARYIRELEFIQENSTRGMDADMEPDNFAPPFLMLSVGTGETRNPYPYEDAKHWGVKWLKPILNILMQGVSESVDYQMQFLLPDYLDENGNRVPRYHRFNVELPDELADMSDASDANRRALQQLGRELTEEHSEAIDAICQALVSMQEARLN